MKNFKKVLLLSLALGVLTGYLSKSETVGMQAANASYGGGGSTGGTGGSGGGGNTTVTISCPGGKRPICAQCSLVSNSCLTACSGDYVCHYNIKGLCYPVLSSCTSL